MSATRSLPLDALRGLAILAMVFSGRIPYGVLPDWMYHAQVPPPGHVFNPAIPGITWVDLVFPFFLFAMGAAIPLALSARLVAGEKLASISWGVLKRGALLVFFAIYVKHITPSVMSAAPTMREWLLCLFGFAMLFPLLMRLPSTWSSSRVLTTRLAGWTGAIVVLILFTAKDGTGFAVTRSDIIILVLANVAVSGSFIWLLTRERLDIRVGLLAFLFALRLTQSLPGWGQWAWNLSPAPWIGTVYFQQYLFIIIPGTIAGDLLLRYAKAPRSAPTTRVWMVALIALLLTPLLLVGMKGRWVVETTLIALTLCAGGWLALRESAVPSEQDRITDLLRSLFGWGAVLLALGLAFEPFEGGIKKDRATMSYYFVTSGLAFFTLLAFIVVIEMRKWQAGFRLMIATGQNPLVAYAGVHSLLTPLLSITGLGVLITKLTPTPWLGALRGWLYTVAISWVGAWCARRGWVLRT